MVGDDQDDAGRGDQAGSEQPTTATNMAIVTSSQRAAPDFIHVSFTNR
jgi:hypothetical protein